MLSVASCIISSPSMERHNTTDSNLRGDGDDHENSENYRLVQMLITEIMNDPNPTELINRNIARISAEVSALANSNSEILHGHGRQSSAISSTGIDQGSNTDNNVASADNNNAAVSSAAAASRRSRLRAARRFFPSDGSSSSSSDDDVNVELEDNRTMHNGICRPVRPVRPLLRGIPGPRISSPIPAPTAVRPRRPTSLWRQLQLRPSPAIFPPHPAAAGGWFNMQNGNQSWRQLRQLGHNVRRFNLQSRLNQRFPSSHGLIIPVARGSQTVLPEKPERIQMGTRSFLPTAKFDHYPDAKPSKPDTFGFSRCHEKAMSAKFVQSVIGMRPESGEEEVLAWNPGMDIFNRFWNETETIVEEDQDENATEEQQVGDQEQEQENRRRMGLPASFISTFNYPESSETDTAEAYLRWDAETTISNHSRHLWDELSSQSPLPPRLLRTTMSVQHSVAAQGSQQQQPPLVHFGSDGVVRLERGRRQRRDVIDTSDDQSSHEDEPSIEAISNRAGTSRVRSNQNVGTSTRYMGGEPLSHETISAMFRMEMPPIPSRTSLGGDNMEANQIPMSLSSSRRSAYSGLGSNRNDNLDVDNGGSSEWESDLSEVENAIIQEDDDDDDDDESNLFSLIPDSDPTPSPLFRGLEDGSWGHGGQGTSCGIYCTEISNHTPTTAGDVMPCCTNGSSQRSSNNGTRVQARPYQPNSGDTTQSE